MPGRLKGSACAPWTALVLALLLIGPARSDPGDKAGWSVGVDPRKRAFLTYVAESDGPRLLVIGCLRDVDSFTVLSEDLVGAAAGTATLTLVDGSARYAVQGRIDPDGITGKLGFAAEFDADAKALSGIAGTLLPVLAGKGPIALTVGPRSLSLPVAGLAAPLKRFKSVCFPR